MKNKISRIWLLSFFLLNALSCLAQSWNRDFSFLVTYSGLPPDNPLRTTLNLIADNNGVSVLSFRFNISYRATLSLTSSKDGIPVLRYKVVPKQTTGCPLFHDFRIDTLLIPTRLTAVIRVYRNQKLLDSLTQTITLGRQQVLLPVSEKMPLASLYVTFDIIGADYTQGDYQRLVQTTDEINAYYGYRRMIKELPQILQKTNEIHPEAGALFYNYAALSRMAGHMASHHFMQRLHLNKKDPLHFRRAYAAVLRKQTRMKTLTEEALKTTKPVPAMQKVDFARQYAGLSMKAVDLSEQYQPYIAGSFREYARIFPHAPEIKAIRLFAGYFDKNDKNGQATLTQEIYKDFVDAAAYYSRRQGYVSALDMLANAARFEQNFPEVRRIDVFDTLLINARDGLAASYLKVAALAMHRHNRLLADRYLKKAFESLKIYDTVISPPASKACYRRFSKGMRLMAVESRNKQQYGRAVFFLENAKKACPADSGIDALHRAVCRDFLQSKSIYFQQLINEKPVSVAYDSLMAFSGIFHKLCHDSLHVRQGSALNYPANMVFQELLAKAQRFQQDSRALQAMHYLDLARRLQHRLLMPPSETLDSLTKLTAIPYILSVIRPADMDIWQKNFAKADSIYQRSLLLARQYGVQDNPAIQQAVGALRKKIDATGCRWRLGQARLLLEKAGSDIAAYRIDEAKSRYLRAKKLYALTFACRHGNTETDSIISVYEKLFRFTEAYHNFTQQLFNEGFGKVLPQFVKLETFYRQQHIHRFGLPFTGIYDFVKNQHSEGVALEAIRYFIEKRQFKTALRYLLLLPHPEQAKAEQKEVATGYAHSEKGLPPWILKKPGFETFAKAYWKALAAKEK